MRNLNSLIIILFAGDDPVSKTALSEALQEKRSRIILGILLVLLLTVIGCAVFGTFRQATSFNVSVITEELRVNTLNTPMSKWPVKDILVSKNCPDDPDEIRYETFSGSIELLPDVTITLTRIASGDLTVKLSHPGGKPTAKLIDEDEEYAGNLSGCAFFHIKDIESRSNKGETIVFPVTGNIEVGNEIRFLTHTKTPLLHSGKISILDKTFFVNENYSVGPFELEMGDSFIVENQSVPSQGFVSITAEPAIHLVFRAKGSHGLIKRYQSESYKLKNSVWSKLYQDEALSIMWMSVLVMLGIIRTYLKFIVDR